VRLPGEAALSREQREVCQAPLKGTVLVVGPPGSGKTVVAVFRQRAAQNQGSESVIAVYNRVLRRYVGVNPTFGEWLNGWWTKATRSKKRFPRVSVVGRYKPYDFREAMRRLRETYADSVTQHGNWGHLILDEAQDFSPDTHGFLYAIGAHFFEEAGLPCLPSMTILADENQRINARQNSTINHIKDAHQLLKRDVYHLRRNYRNTREIALVARCFHVGAASGETELPERRGDKPRLVFTNGLDDTVQRIANFSKLHPEQEIGVLVQYRRTQKRYFNRLSHRLKGTGIHVQLYDSTEQNDESLIFDRPGTVTVLCFNSAKGLEFDTVFLPDLQTLRFDEANEDHTKMSLYVMCSRARSLLTLMVERDIDKNNLLWSVLPKSPTLEELFDVDDGDKDRYKPRARRPR
jgi:DNA helicase-2/ATP-dependent DNA helicase PcrA